MIALAGVPAGAQQPIGSNQHFSGLVNGTRTSAVVYTVCAGPGLGRPHRPGLVGGQTLSVVRAKRGHGYTGPFRGDYAWFVPQDTGDDRTRGTEVHLVQRAQPIPTSVQVPWRHRGQVEFSSCPYLAPCAFGWIPDYVAVQFVNIAD